MLDYLNTRVIRYSSFFEWIQQEINDLEKKNPHHKFIFDCLKDKVSSLEEECKKLENIIDLKEERIYERAFPIIHFLDSEISGITEFYITAIQKETKNDLFIRDIMLEFVKRGGIYWIKDIIVSLESNYGIHAPIVDAPIIFGPFYQHVSLSGISLFQHELGHNVFYKNIDKLENELFSIVHSYFSNMGISSGPLDPMVRQERDKKIQMSTVYWNNERLNELFCDIYATYICGPSYYFSNIDVAIRTGTEPKLVDQNDEHPPWDTRIYACYKTLLEIHREEEVVKSMNNLWEKYLKIKKNDPLCNFTCSHNLIDKIVEGSIKNIKELLPSASPCCEPLLDHSELDKISSLTLKHILDNQLVKILKDPNNYPKWERNAFEAIQTRI